MTTALRTLAWRGFCGGGLRAGRYALVTAAAARLIAIVRVLFLMTDFLFLGDLVSSRPLT